MNIAIEKNDAVNALLRVKLAEDDYKQRVENKLKDYGKKISLKGFRPGKVPAQLVKKMYGKSILVDEISQMVSEYINNYIREEKLEVLGQPLPNKDTKVDFDEDKDFEFIYDLGLAPDFKIDFGKHKFTRYTLKPGEKEVEETLQNLRSQFGQMTNPEVVEEGDFVYGKLKADDGSLETDTLVPLNKVKTGQAAVFVGHKLGEVLAFDIRTVFGDDDAVLSYVTGKTKEESVNIKGGFTFSVDKISRQAPAELNQEFFDRVFGQGTVTDEAAFRAKLEETVADNYKRETENLFKNEVRKYLTENVTMDLPKEFLKRWLLAQNEGKATMEQIEAEFDKFEQDLKWTLIKNKIAAEQDLKAEYQEVKDMAVKSMKEQFGSMPLNAELEERILGWADGYLQENNGENFNRVYENVLADKVYGYLYLNAPATDKTVNLEEFKQIVDSLN